jgi:hypothetical protein
MDFLPDNYETPQGGSAYMKFQQGDNKFRILSKPVIGWVDWKDKVPFRFPFKNKPEQPFGNQPIRHFWAMVVFDYADQQVKVLEITQSTIQKAIEHLAKDEDWGSPGDYDLKINKSGQDKSTEYKVNPSPKKPLTKEIKDAALAKPINLDALFKNADPFVIANGEQTKLIFEELPF